MAVETEASLAATAVGRVLHRHVPHGELQDVLAVLPATLRPLVAPRAHGSRTTDTLDARREHDRPEPALKRRANRTSDRLAGPRQSWAWAMVQSALSGGPSRVMSYFSKSAATTARSGIPFRVSGPSSS